MKDNDDKMSDKGHDEDDDTNARGRRDIAPRWNPFAWLRDMERSFEQEFRHFGFGRWTPDEMPQDASPFTKGPEGKSSGWSYHFQTGMDSPEIRTWGDVKPEDVERILSEGGAPALGPGQEKGEDQGPEGTEGTGNAWNPFDLFRDVFEGFSRPFFANMRQALGGAAPAEVDAADIQPTGEVVPLPTVEEPAAEASPQPKADRPAGKVTVEPFTDVFYDKDGSLVGTLEIPGATEESLKISVHDKTIHVEAEGPLRKYAKDIEVFFEPNPQKVSCRICNGICELRAEKP